MNNASTEKAKLRVTTRIVAAGFLLGIFVSLPLWIGERQFPYAPAFQTISSDGGIIDKSIALGLGLALMMTLIYPTIVVLSASVMSGSVLLLGDQMRLQPWVYQYLLTFVVLIPGLFSGDEKAALRSLNSVRFMIAATYFFSGLQKFNPDFYGRVFPWLVQPAISNFSDTAQGFVLLSGLFVPLLEAAFGLALLSVKTRKLGVLGIVAMHLFILLAIGPLGRNWNAAVWPWNIVMVALVLLLFGGKGNVTWREIVNIQHRFVKELVILLFGLLPILNWMGWWDSYLSAALYSGNSTWAELRMNREVYSTFPPEVQALAQLEGEEYLLDVKQWTITELGVPPNPEARVFRRAFKSLCSRRVGQGSLTLTIHHKRTLIAASQTTTENCP